MSHKCLEKRQADDLHSILAVIGFRLSNISTAALQIDPTLHLASFICWTQTETSFSIITVTTPMMVVFLADLVTYYGGAGGLTVSETACEYNFYDRARGQTAINEGIPLGTLQSGTSHKSGKLQNETYIRARSDGTYDYGVRGRSEHRASAAGPANSARHRGDGENSVDATSVGSGDSQKMIIRRDLAYYVSYDN